jgi:23S rRNA (adenine-N6)-dimethyltransferase
MKQHRSLNFRHNDQNSHYPKDPSFLKHSQNFLKDHNLISELIEKSDIGSQDTVLDIGAGSGVISEGLSRVAKLVWVIELDDVLFKSLEKRFRTVEAVQLFNGDFMRFKLPKDEYKVFSNIPFNETSAIINKLFLTGNSPKSAHLILQKEAAMRFMGTGEGFLLNFLLVPFYDFKITHEFSRTDFVPSPNVDTVLLSISRRETPLIIAAEMDNYRDFVTYVLFQQKPTFKLRTNKIFTSQQFHHLAKDLGFSPEIQANKLTLDQWIGVFRYYESGVLESKKDTVRGSFDKFLVTRELQPKFLRTRQPGTRNFTKV